MSKTLMQFARREGADSERRRIVGHMEALREQLRHQRLGCANDEYSRHDRLTGAIDELTKLIDELKGE